MPTSTRPFQDDYRKDSKSGDIKRKRKNMVTEKEVSENRTKQIIIWNTFWRRNIHRFIIDAMGVPLHPFQIIWVYLMSVSPFFVAICSRAASKSFILACYSVARSILYPGNITLIAASTIKQAGLIVSNKVTYLRDNSVLCQMEIKNITANNNLYEVSFYNGSKIVVVAANEGSRGWRSNDLIIDEYAICDKQIIDEVLKPTLFPRQTPYLQKEEYAGMIEPVRSYYISSAKYVHDSWYKTAKLAMKGMLEDSGAGFFATDYLTTIKHSLKTREQIEEERRDNAAFSLEYENIPGKSNINSFYQIGQFKRTIRKAFYPIRPQDYHLKKNPFGIKKIDDEIRIMGLDFASRGGKSNDNSVMSLIRLIPSKKGYERSCVYMESSHGANHIIQAKRIKDVFYEFQCDYIAMDIQQIGISIFDSLSEAYFNEEKGEQFPPFTVMEIPEIDEPLKEDLRKHTLGLNAIPVIFPISASASSNTDMHTYMRSSLQKKLWSWLIDDVEGERFLVNNVKEYFSRDDDAVRAWLLHPYVQTNLFISEAINLEMKVSGSNIKLLEGSGKKDRYSSILYANALATVFDQELLKSDDGMSEWEKILTSTFVM
jgi:hypothetical protein